MLDKAVDICVNISTYLREDPDQHWTDLRINSSGFEFFISALHDQASSHHFEVENAPTEALPSPCLSQVLLAIQGEGEVQQKAGLDAEAAVHIVRTTFQTSSNVRSRTLMLFLPVNGLVEVLCADGSIDQNMSISAQRLMNIAFISYATCVLKNLR